LLILAYCWC